MKRWLQLLLAPIVLGFVVLTLVRLDFTEITMTLPTADVWLLGAAAALVVVPLLLRSLRSWLLLKRSGLSVPAARTAIITIYGFSLGKLTPGGAGDLVRVGALHPYGVRVPDAVAIVLFERVLDVFVLLVVVAAALAVSFLDVGLAVLFLAGIGAAVVSLVVGRRLIGTRIQRILPGRVRALSPSHQTSTALFDGRTLTLQMLLTVVAFVTEGVRALLVVRALGLNLGLADAIVVSQVSFFAGLVSLVPLGLGSWEAAVVWLLGLYEHDPNVGAAAAALLRAGITVPSLLAGAVALAWMRAFPGRRAGSSTSLKDPSAFRP